MRKTKQLKGYGSLAALLFTLGIAFQARAEANKFELAAGFYQLSADSNGVTESVSGLGVYRLTYHHSLLSQLEIGLGYTLFMSDVVTGDMGFGPDLSVFYYPFTSASDVELKTESVNLRFGEKWRPFIGAGFHQRNFQSLDSSYAGFGASIGTEFDFSRIADFKFELRYLMLAGPSRSDATQIEPLIGVVFLL